jgi:hypothetical protein
VSAPRKGENTTEGKGKKRMCEAVARETIVSAIVEKRLYHHLYEIEIISWLDYLEHEKELNQMIEMAEVFVGE